MPHPTRNMSNFLMIQYAMLVMNTTSTLNILTANLNHLPYPSPNEGFHLEFMRITVSNNFSKTEWDYLLISVAASIN